MQASLASWKTSTKSHSAFYPLQVFVKCQNSVLNGVIVNKNARKSNILELRVIQTSLEQLNHFSELGSNFLLFTLDINLFTYVPHFLFRRGTIQGHLPPELDDYSTELKSAFRKALSLVSLFLMGFDPIKHS